MTEEFLYRPSPWGQRFHALKTKEALGAGSAGPGKSLVLLMDPLFQVHSEHSRAFDPKNPNPIRPGHSLGWALHLRRTMPMLRQTIARSHRMFPSIDHGAKWDTQTSTWTFSSGYRYQFGHCADSEDHVAFMSNEYSYLGMDELNQFEEEQYEWTKTRVRSSDPILRGMLKIRAMSNPTVRKEGQKFTVRGDRSWVRKYFVDPNPQGNEILKRKVVLRDGRVEWWTRIYLPATLYDNPDKEFVRDYEVTLSAAKPHIRRAMLYGDWYTTAHSYYGDAFEKGRHVATPFIIPDRWAKFRSMDWGFKQKGCIHWYAMDEDNNLWVIGELTFQEKLVPEVARMVAEKEIAWKFWRGSPERGRSRLTGPADTQLWEKRGDSGLSKAEEFQKHGVSWDKADKTSRQRNAELVYGRLMDHRKGTTVPGLMFFDSCRELLRTLPMIEEKEDDVDTPEDGGEDHWHDSLLYGCAYASRGKRGRRTEKDDLFKKEEPKHEERGTSGYGF